MSKQDVLVEALDTEAQFLWTASGDGIIGESADLWCAYTGQSQEAIQNWGWIEALHPDDRERARHLWTQAAQHKRFYETWYRIRNAKDEYQTFLIRHMPILQRDGTIREWVCQPSTTERLLLEPGNWQANALHQLFVGQTSIGMSYVSIDGRYLDVNAPFCSMVGYSREELIGRRIEDITHPQDIGTNWAVLDQQLAGLSSSYAFEKRYIRKDGEAIWVKLTGLLLRLPSAEPFCFFGITEDITERKRVEAEQKRLLELERAAGAAERRKKQEVAALVDQFKSVFEAMTDGVVFRDVEGKLLLVNAAGYRLMEVGSKTDFAEKSYPDFYALYEISDERRQPLPAEHWPMSRILRGEVLSSEQAVDVMMRLPSGREVQYSYSGAPVYDRGGQMIGGVCVFRDVTEVRQKERHVQQALNDLLTIVEEVARLPIQSDNSAEVAPLQPRYLYTVGRNLTEIIRRVLQCRF
ncbi:MAG TPA: PAS domain S-box protein, partial [Ktedonobacteraceae bacterium]|nr:PAS domain S-box protein [Ktedonobacteraceae bacterium]